MNFKVHIVVNIRHSKLIRFTWRCIGIRTKQRLQCLRIGVCVHLRWEFGPLNKVATEWFRQNAQFFCWILISIWCGHGPVRRNSSRSPPTSQRQYARPCYPNLPFTIPSIILCDCECHLFIQSNSVFEGTTHRMHSMCMVRIVRWLDFGGNFFAVRSKH